MAITAPRIRVRSDVVFTRVSDSDGILLNLATKRYYSLNETGMRIWEALERDDAIPAAAGALVLEYDVTGDEAAALVAEFVASLRSEGLVYADESLAIEPGRGEGAKGVVYRTVILPPVGAEGRRVPG